MTLHGLRLETRTLLAMVHRDLLRLVNRPQEAGLMLIQPLLYLFVLGGGLAALIPAAATGGDYRRYLFPGILLMTAQVPAIGVGVRHISDRDSGYLREALMAPARRSTLLLGPCLGGTAVGTVQGALLLAVAPAAGLPYRPGLLIALVAVVAVAAFTLAAMATALATALHDTQTFHTALSIGMLPMLFGSGAFFPLSAVPGWLTPLTALNPFAYAVDLMHRATVPRTPPGVRWAGHAPPAALELATLAVLGTATLLAAARRFARPR